MFNIGETSDDSLIFICTFNEYSDKLKEINNEYKIDGYWPNLSDDIAYIARKFNP